jgi:hypothetical protein
MGFEPDFAPKITTVWGHLHGKLRAGVADGHMQFRNKALSVSRSWMILVALPHLSGNSHVKRVGWSALGFGSIHTFYDIFVGQTTLNRAIHIGCPGYYG